MVEDRGDWKGKKTYCVEDIKLMTQQEIEDTYGSPKPSGYDGFPLATICFKFGVKYVTLGVQELLDLLSCWIKAEEMRYPFLKERNNPKNDFFFKEIEKVFENHRSKSEVEKNG